MRSGQSKIGPNVRKTSWSNKPVQLQKLTISICGATSVWSLSIIRIRGAVNMKSWDFLGFVDQILLSQGLC